MLPTGLGIVAVSQKALTAHKSAKCPRCFFDFADMVAFTSSGNTAVRLARQRSRVPIIGVTPNEQAARQLALLWGVHSVKSEEIGSFREMVERASGHAINEGYARQGDYIVVIAGVPFGQAGTTNNIRVVSVS